MNDTKELLSAEQILAVEDLDTVDVEVPEWNGSIRLRALSAADAMKFTDVLSGPARKSAHVRILALSCVDSDGTLLFSQNQLEALKKKNLRIINRLATEALRLNELIDEKSELLKNA